MAGGSAPLKSIGASGIGECHRFLAGLRYFAALILEMTGAQQARLAVGECYAFPRRRFGDTVRRWSSTRLSFVSRRTVAAS